MIDYAAGLVATTGLALTMSVAPLLDQSAGSRSSHLQALERCQAEPVATARLACFDTAAAKLIGATKRGETTLVDRAELREVRRSLFGFSMPKLPFFKGDDSAKDVSATLESKIQTVRPLGYGRYRLTLADGDAVWETTESFENMDEPRGGQAIIIKRGSLGRYTLRINGQRGLQGRRVG